MGDPAGVGPDIALAAWQRRREDALPPFFVIGSPDCLRERASLLGIEAPLKVVAEAAEAADRFQKALPVLPLPVAIAAHVGAPDASSAAAVIGAIEAGVDLIRKGEALALVTNPINKHVLHETGFAFPGHTEFLAALAQGWGGRAPRPVMMLACEELRVVPATIHIPLREVPAALTQDLIVATVETTARGLSEDFGIAKPRIAVTGLNPHAGEGGDLGREEIEVIRPAIERLAAAGLRVSGPHPADALFHPAARATYDAAVAMYHDQALVPIKTLAFDRAVNVTLGLPFVRTSPDHGTAYDIAGTGRASAGSLIAALKLAGEIAKRRRVQG